jgi:hypothetical protein
MKASQYFRERRLKHTQRVAEFEQAREKGYNALKKLINKDLFPYLPDAEKHLNEAQRLKLVTSLARPPVSWRPSRRVALMKVLLEKLSNDATGNERLWNDFKVLVQDFRAQSLAI